MTSIGGISFGRQAQANEPADGLPSVARRFTLRSVIRSFRHRGLKRFYERDDRSLIAPALRNRAEAMLAQLDVAGSAEAMRLPGYRLHALKGRLRGYWSVAVGANWRIIFRFRDGDVYDVELIDYH